jgi:cytochrome c553
MKKILIAAMAAAATLAFAGMAQADGDMDAGKKKAAKCGACHGKKGEGKGKNPAIAGWEADKFMKAMNDYKSGAKKSKKMASAKKLSDADIENLAAYYGSLK